VKDEATEIKPEKMKQEKWSSKG